MHQLLMSLLHQSLSRLCQPRISIVLALMIVWTWLNQVWSKLGRLTQPVWRDGMFVEA